MKGQFTKDNGEKVDFSDMLLLLDNGTTIIGRIVADSNKQDFFVYIFKPCSITHTQDGTMLFPWIPESSDTFYLIPAGKILNVSNPRQELVAAYREMYIDEKIEDVEAVPVKKVGKQFH